jgi:hypothetical protein
MLHHFSISLRIKTSKQTVLSCHACRTRTRTRTRRHCVLFRNRQAGGAAAQLRTSQKAAAVQPHPWSPAAQHPAHRCSVGCASQRVEVEQWCAKHTQHGLLSTRVRVPAGHVPALLGPRNAWTVAAWVAQYGQLVLFQLLSVLVVLVSDPATIQRVTRTTGAWAAGAAEQLRCQQPAAAACEPANGARFVQHSHTHTHTHTAWLQPPPPPAWLQALQACTCRPHTALTPH